MQLSNSLSSLHQLLVLFHFLSYNSEPSSVNVIKNSFVLFCSSYFRKTGKRIDPEDFVSLFMYCLYRNFFFVEIWKGGEGLVKFL